jgi:2-(1,2-epoxy-1,2-dihydrophenyl)acetyl-CoA isomerase
MNAMTQRMVRELHELLSELTRDPEPRVLVLTGAGGPGNGFCPGADIKHRLSGAAEAELAQDGPIDPAVSQVARLLHELPAVTVAAINGAVAGAGLGLALACDVRFAARSARFATAFLARGLSGDMGVPWSLLRIVGAARAREICLLADKFTADDAERYGLVSRVWDDHEFVDGLAAQMDRLASFSPPALRALKANLLDAESVAFEQYLTIETTRHVELAASPESRASFDEFLSKRQPR